jgi:hypothetical protein
MKRSLFTRPIKQTLLAVPAAALMLGAAHAGTTVGLNFQAWYYDSGATPQTIGYGAGYQTTGFPVTAAAFGVPAANWFNPDPLPCQAAISGYATFGGVNTTFAGGLTANLLAPNAWQSGIGEQVAGWNPETVPPGNDEVTWGYLDSNAGQSPAVTVAGLAAKFPNGYVIQTIAAETGTASFNDVDISDGVTTSTLVYSTYFVTGSASDGYDGNGTVGLSAPSGVFTADTININPEAQTSPNRSTLAGFIITDQPLITRSYPAASLTTIGGSFTLNGVAMGIGNLSYQWQHAGTNLPGATSASFTNASAAAPDSGNYQLVVTSDAFPSMSVTGAVLNVTVIPTHAARTATWDADTSSPGAQDGSGIWSNTTTNWWSGSFDDYWGSADSAVFGAGGTSAYTVTLSDNITANALTFNSGTYTLTNAAGQGLTLNGNSTITMNTDATIAVPLSTTNTLFKAGPGKLTLSGAMASTNTFVSAGTLEVLAKNGDSPYVVTNSATLKIGYSTGGGYANSALQLYGDGTAATTGLYLLGGKTYNVNGGVVVNSAPTTIRQYGSGLAAFGIFDINSNPGLSITAAASGSVIDANIQMVNDGYGMVVTTAAGANTATGDLVLNGPLSVDGHNGIYGLIKRGGGSLRLNAAATTNNSGLNLSAGSVICGAANCIGTNATLKTSAGATLDLNGTSQTVSNGLALAGTLKMTINKGGTPNCNTLTAQQLNLGGTLVVTNIGGTLALGDTFKLFPSVGSDAFATLVLPVVPNGLAWEDNSAVDGTIKVVVGSVPPSIVTDLSGGTNFAYVGGSSTFTITASGDPTLQYQWKKNGTTVVGLNSPTLTLTSLSTGSAGYYSCTVTNNYGSAKSQTNYLQVATPSAYVAAVVQDAPQSFWPLNETGPSTAYDYWSGNDGTQNGSLTLGVAGPMPPSYAGFNAGTLAYQFDGGSAYIDCGTGAALSGATDFSLEAWVNTTSAAYGQILQQRYSGGYNGEYEFGINADGTLDFMIYGGSAYQFSFNSTNTSTPVNDGNWHHVVAVRSGTSGMIYVDGLQVGAASGPVAPLDPTFEVYMGADLRGYTSFFNGTMCEVAIYNHALSSAQVANHAVTGITGATTPTLSLVGKSLVWPSGTLVSSPVLGAAAIWTPVSGAASPYLLPPVGSTNSTMFYRIKR